jgi:hypothetical protein
MLGSSIELLIRFDAMAFILHRVSNASLACRQSCDAARQTTIPEQAEPPSFLVRVVLYRFPLYVAYCSRVNPGSSAAPKQCPELRKHMSNTFARSRSEEEVVRHVDGAAIPVSFIFRSSVHTSEHSLFRARTTVCRHTKPVVVYQGRVAECHTTLPDKVIGYEMHVG